MRRMPTINQIETLNHISYSPVKTLYADTLFNIPRIELISPDTSGISSNYNVDILAAMNDDEGDYSVEVQLTDQGIKVDPDFNATGECYLTILNLPTSDPGVKGAVWNDNGVLKISAGE